MGLLEGKNALVFGLANERSIAWGITQAFHREGANIGISYAGEALERRVKPLAEKVGCQWVEECDVTSDEQIAAVAKKAGDHFGRIDVLVHSIAFAGREELSRPYYQTTREGFKNAMDITVFSFVALTNAFLPLLNPNASIMCLTYGSGATKVAPHYNVMGVAKAALEASVRYLASDFGPANIRVNAIAPGATLTPRTERDDPNYFENWTKITPTGRPGYPADIANTALFLLSPEASHITGQTILVDGGWTLVGRRS